MKLVAIFLTTLFLISKIYSLQKDCMEDSYFSNPIYTVKDIGESAYFLNERLHKQGIRARTIIINAKNREILFNETSLAFFNNKKTINAYHAFVTSIRYDQLPPACVRMLTLVDLKGHNVYVSAYDSDGCFIDLKPVLFPTKY
ncbi:MAG: hypothetical protein P4L16_07140 [Chlamydiales bacterium]|nr:hypothetical protein [Chlamydiales bacterium]